MNIKTKKEGNSRYFMTYAVRAEMMEGRITTHLMFLNREDAEANAEHCREKYKGIYKHVWVISEPIFC